MLTRNRRKKHSLPGTWKLQDAKAEVKKLASEYTEPIKELNLEMDYCIYTLESQGKE